MGLTNKQSNTIYCSVVEDPKSGDVRFGTKKKTDSGYATDQLYNSMSGKLI